MQLSDDFVIPDSRSLSRSALKSSDEFIRVQKRSDLWL